MVKKVSLIIAAYNAEKYLQYTIDSVLAQTYNNFECIIVDDGSTDNTFQIISNVKDKRFKVYHQTNKGQDSAFNLGFKESEGEYVKFLDSDDIINEEMLKLQAETLDKNPFRVAYSEWYRFFGKNPTSEDLKYNVSYWRDMNPLDFLLADGDGPMLQCGIMMIPRSIIIKVGLWDERLILFNDTEFFTRVILKSEGVSFTKNARLFYRSGIKSSLTAQNSRKYFESTFLATNLIEQYLLESENSNRVKQNISNIYFTRLYDMYPNYPDLIKLHEEKISTFGRQSHEIEGGKIHTLIYKYFGWKFIKYLHLVRAKFK